MTDLTETKAASETPLPASMPDWLCPIAPDGSHADAGVFPDWWLQAYNAS